MNPSVVRIVWSKDRSQSGRRRASAEELAWNGVKAFFVVTFAAVAILTGASSRASQPAPRRTVLPARVQPGRLEPVQTAVAGRLASKAAKVGQTVAKGDLLAEIENPELLSDLRLARRRLELARRRSAEEGQRGLAAKTRLRVAEAQLAAAVAARNGALARSRSAAEANEGPALERARRNAVTIRKLAEQRLATAAELDAAEAAVERERDNLAVRRESRDRLAEELAAAESQAEAAGLQLQALRAGTETSWEIEIAEAAAVVKRLERRAESLRVIAPVEGVVAFARVAGSAVSEGEVLFRIGDTATLTLEVPATAALAREVREGDPVTARIPLEPPAEVDAYVSGVEWAPEGGQAYLIRVSVNNPERGAFLAGLEGTVAFRH